MKSTGQPCVWVEKFVSVEAPTALYVEFLEFFLDPEYIETLTEKCLDSILKDSKFFMVGDKVRCYYATINSIARRLHAF